MRLQYNLEWELYQAMDYIAGFFGLVGIEQTRDNKQLEDWELFKRYKLPKSSLKRQALKEYDESILNKFSYPRIESWEREGISVETIKRNRIGYYPGGEQITIPHRDIEGRLIGIRGRSLSEEEGKRYGKYRPLIVNRQIYNHPLSMNLYNINNSKDNMRRSRVAVIFEGEKSCLQY